MTAPASLSIFDEPEMTLSFCNQLQQLMRKRQARVFIDLAGVKRVSSDALLLMRCIMEGATGVSNVGGNLPSDPLVAAKFKQSGFFAGFAKPPKELPQPQGMIHRKTNRKVASEIAADLVDFAVAHATVPESIANSSYKNLVELMSNTRNHAGDEGKIRWMTSVYCQDGAAYFTFIDLGVGILRSAAPRSFLRSVGLAATTYGEQRLLRNVFDGSVGASTSIPGRGRGLPTMKSYADAGLLPKLQVLTSAVCGEVAELTFRPAGANLRGTVFRWRTRSSVSES